MKFRVYVLKTQTGEFYPIFVDIFHETTNDLLIYLSNFPPENHAHVKCLKIATKTSPAQFFEIDTALSQKRLFELILLFEFSYVTTELLSL